SRDDHDLVTPMHGHELRPVTLCASDELTEARLGILQQPAAGPRPAGLPGAAFFFFWGRAKNFYYSLYIFFCQPEGGASARWRSHGRWPLYQTDDAAGLPTAGRRRTHVEEAEGRIGRTIRYFPQEKLA